MKFIAETDMFIGGHYVFAGEEYEVDEVVDAPKPVMEEPSVTAPSVTPRIRHVVKRRAKPKAKPKAKAPAVSVEKQEQETLTLQEQ